MPAWWGRKSTKSKEDSHPLSYTVLTSKPSKHSSSKNKRYSSEDPSSPAANRVSPRGFDSDSYQKRGHPLPRPSVSDHGGSGVGLGSGSASGSISSVSSSGSDESHCVVGYRGQFEMNSSTRSRSPNPGSRSPYPGSRSPGPASRGPSRPTSPLHPRFGGMNMDSPTGDGKNQCHPLPLPPGSPTSPSSMPSIPGTPSTLSTWKKGKLLGRGTFGHVYLGFNSDSGQMCAIKEVKVVSDDQASKECLRQLNQEIGLLKRLSHSNIVRYYGSEMCEETLSVYLEYVSGGSIHKLLQEYGAFKEPVIQNYTRQILSGLSYLHGKNTVHRDIKGANILVDPNGEIKLADFGMAKHITACSSMLSFKGSPYWMAPEVVMNTNGYSLAVDIWSLGCTILEMASSKPPWSQYEGVAAIFKIGNSKDMPDIPNHLSNDAKDFIKSCLQRDPSARPTASELLKHRFIRDHVTTRVANIKVTRDAFPHTFDGTRTPPVLELHSSGGNMTSSDGDFAMKPLVTNTRALRSTRDDCRMFTSSLPVSPSCSPHRQYGPEHKSCFLSPPHPTYAALGQNGYNVGDFSLHPMRPNAAYSQDPFFEASLLNVQLPGTSPRTRPI